MRWIYGLLVLAALVAAFRVAIGIRRARSRPRNDWDAQMVRNLRASGANAFTQYEVDFFFSMPDQAACAALIHTLEPEGFKMDARDMSASANASGFSVHATKRLQISVGAMQELSDRFNELAENLSGNYDGWNTDKSRT